MSAREDAIASALQHAWDEFTSDTGCFPDCFEWHGGKLYADFDRGNFAATVARHLPTQEESDG